MSRARELSKLGNLNVLSADDVSNEVGIASTVPRSTLDVRGELQVGTGIQVGPAGVITASSFDGGLSGNIVATACTFTTGNFTGNVTIGGTLTYEDVTNVDALGIVTARAGINVSGGQFLVGSGVTIGNAGVATFSGTSDVHLLDNVQLNVGDGSDLQLYHNATDSFIKSGTNKLRVLSDKFRFNNAANDETLIHAEADGAVTLYYNNSTKFATTNDGTVTTGIATATNGFSGTLIGAAVTVNGSDAVTSFGGVAALTLEGGDANSELVNLKFTTGAGGPLAVISGIANSTGAYPNSQGTLLFSTYNGNAGGFERMRITSTGLVGINTDSPGNNHNLEILGQASAYATINLKSQSLGHGSGLELGAVDDDDYGSIYQFASSAGGNYTGRMRFIAGGTETFNLVGGNAGVGEASPDVRLHVTETIDTAYTVDTATQDANNLLKLENPSTTAEAFAGMQLRTGNGADMYVGVIQQSGNAGDLYVTNQNSPNKEIVRVKSTGLVGIATTNPQTTLHIQEASEPTVSLWEGGTKRAAFQAQSSATYLYSYQDSPLIFSSATGTAFSEKLRIGAEGLFSFNNGELVERVKITAGKLSDNTNINLSSGMVHYFTTQESTTCTPNIRSSASATLNSLMDAGDVVTVTLITTAAAGGYSANVTIDGNAVTEEWVGGSAPSAGGDDGLDIYVYTIICTHATNTGDSGFKVIANLTNAT